MKNNNTYTIPLHRNPDLYGQEIKYRSALKVAVDTLVSISLHDCSQFADEATNALEEITNILTKDAK